jgi:hypothetical protein
MKLAEFYGGIIVATNLHMALVDSWSIQIHGHDSFQLCYCVAADTDSARQPKFLGLHHAGPYCLVLCVCITGKVVQHEVHEVQPECGQVRSDSGQRGCGSVTVWTYFGSNEDAAAVCDIFRNHRGDRSAYLHLV